MSTKPHLGRENGQILVVFAGGVILLLAIAALVIDIGFVFWIRGLEQNAADPGAIAAARHIQPAPDKPMMDRVACFYARNNGFFPAAIDDTGCQPANDPNGATLTINYPPSAAAGQFAGRSGFVEVVISRPHQTFFARALGIDSIGVSASAVAAFNDGDSNPGALVALDPHGCEAGKIQGTGGSGGAKVTIQPVTDPGTGLPYAGGYVQVNSDCDGPVDPPVLAACGSGSGALKVAGSSSLDAPGVYTYGDCARDGGATITTDDANMVHQGTTPTGDPLQDLPAPRIDTSIPGQPCGVGGTPTDATTNNDGCSGAGGSPTKWEGPPCVDDNTIKCVSLTPGVYYGGWQVTNDKYRLLLSPGVYIIAGGGIKQTGGTIEAVSGTGLASDAQIMIYSTDNPLFASACQASWTSDNHCQGPLNFTAGGQFRAFGLGDAACAADPTACPYRGLLLWQDGRGSCPTYGTSISDPDPCSVGVAGGTTAISIGGTIYAPDQLVTLNGSSAVSGDVASIQIISYRWKIVGDSDLLMPYDPSLLYRLDQKGLVR